MKPFALLFIGLAFVLPLFGAPSPDAQKLAAADCTFGFRLLKELNREQPARNIFVSPYSASTALQMVCNGAGGRTKTEMAQVLGTADLPQNAVNAATLEIQKSLDAAGTNIILNTANALWCREGVAIKPAFIAANQQFFRATVESLDFDRPRTVSKINGWVAEKTHGKIGSILQGPIDPATKLFLANAIYFKGKWQEPFDKNATIKRAFHLRGGAQKKVPMMEQSRHFDYRRGAGYQAVRLDYENSPLAMYIFLPDENSSPEKLLSIMNGDNWQRITKPGFSGQDGTLQLPKFRIEYGVELIQPLEALGMKEAFSDTADLSGIANHLFVSDVLQKAFVQVNEEGTEAAAVTFGAVAAAAEPMPTIPPFRMIVDRPFLFLIEDQNTGTILFTGVIFDPGA
ncbi:MAG TPA: serpin family protein [Verrucomicrobiae bacterium]|nr:serpin family protein [Verrucomicrobiae bacterium]